MDNKKLSCRFEIVSEFYAEFLEFQGLNSENETTFSSPEYYHFLKVYVYERSEYNIGLKKAVSFHDDWEVLSDSCDDEVFTSSVTSPKSLTQLGNVNSRLVNPSSSDCAKVFSETSDYFSMTSHATHSESECSLREVALPMTPVSDKGPFSNCIFRNEVSKLESCLAASTTQEKNTEQKYLSRSLNSSMRVHKNLRNSVTISSNSAIETIRHFGKNLYNEEELFFEVILTVSAMKGLEECITETIFLKNLFQISEQKMEETVIRAEEAAEKIIYEEKNAAENKWEFKHVENRTLHIWILEATELHCKTAGACHSYASISINGISQHLKTRIVRGTVNPEWNQDFHLSINNWCNDVVLIKIRRECETKLFQTLKGNRKLIGAVQVPAKQLLGTDIWLPLENAKGLIHIKGEICVENDKRNHVRENSFSSLLAKFVYSHLKMNNYTNEKPPWCGELCPEALSILAQHISFNGLSEPVQHLSWWIVVSMVPVVDYGYLLDQLLRIQNHINKMTYSESDLENLAISFYNWVQFAKDKLKNFRTWFPPSISKNSKYQFVAFLRICNNLHSHADSNVLLQAKGIADLLEELHNAVTYCVKDWWSNLVEEQLRGVVKQEEQIKGAVKIASETFAFLNQMATIYGPTLLEETNVHYFSEVFILLTHNLKSCVFPPLMNVCNQLNQHLKLPNGIKKSSNENERISGVLEGGLLLMDLYTYLGDVQSLSRYLTLEAQKESGLYGFHKWFNRAIVYWIDSSHQEALLKINDAVEQDTSAANVLIHLKKVKSSWQYLSWPEPKSNLVLISKILEDACSYGVTFADLLIKKTENFFNDNYNNQVHRYNNICIGLNRIDRVRHELSILPNTFEIKIAIDKLCSSQVNGEEIAKRSLNHVNLLMEHTLEYIDFETDEFIKRLIDRLKVDLRNAVINSCQSSSISPLMSDFLDPLLEVIRSNMNHRSKKRFLQRLWEILVGLFTETVKRNANRRPASFFGGAHSIVTNAYEVITAEDGNDLPNEVAILKEHSQLLDLMQYFTLSSDTLIAKYYSKRFEEQSCGRIQSKAELFVRAHFARIGTLSIRVIMSKDMKVSREAYGCFLAVSSRGEYANANVTVELVPTGWFPNVRKRKTRTEWNRDPAVFDVEFDFNVRAEDRGVENGFVLLTLLDHRTFIGEAVIPLRDLPCVNDARDPAVQNMQLKATTPGLRSGYQSLEALRHRRWSDRVARRFLRRHLRGRGR